MARPGLRRAIRVAGIALLILSLGYVAREIARHWEEIAAWNPSRGDLATLAGLTVLYGAMLYLLAETWHRLLGLFGSEPRRRSWRSYALTQIARYLPGNVAHLLGRAAVLGDGPLSPGQLGLATLLELIVVPAGAVAALGLAVLLAPGSAALLDAFGWPGTPARFLALVVAVLAAAGAGMALVGRGSMGGRVSGIGTALVLCTMFMIGLGSIFGIIAGLVGDGPFWIAATAGICAWLVGYATPGAPGGLGPREAMLLLLLSDVMAPGALVLAAAMFRLVTVAGDILCFASGAALLRDGAVEAR